MNVPLNRRRFEFTGRTCFMFMLEIVLLTLAIWRLGVVFLPEKDHTPATPNAAAQHLAQTPLPSAVYEALPTPTTDASIPLRLITFPGASMSAPIIPAGRVEGTWETRHLGDAVGHLVGTSWFDDVGGNIVLAGHVENYAGAPGPFKHLFEAEIGDLVIISDGYREEHYRVSLIERANPYDITWVAQDGEQRVTLITCTDWDWDQEAYLGRLIIVAEPIITAVRPGDPK
ncbi:MAG: sortase [Anaerolineae bacterium]|nr:sortase [Anaerolineae bacterium]